MFTINTIIYSISFPGVSISRGTSVDVSVFFKSFSTIEHSGVKTIFG